ncbi:hypothetical protein UFOVP996_33 [uncultured Caudovirales phage]|jgi:hypothetical protein|uniref:Uncharacterized protein n=1 Tax=uncultured Caudovirales phage TaxID=2100421 RepID=A0A6J5Q2U7_9CAUD|nr:hypothetical protein UFOVP996_33 [uncultured Caudovirales phage]
MIIDDFTRDEENQVWAICGADKVHLSAEYIAAHKPQVGDEIVQEEPKVEEAVAEAPPQE